MSWRTAHQYRTEKYSTSITDTKIVDIWGRDIRDGVKHRISSTLPIKITQSSDWIVAHTHGDAYTLALKKDGTLWGWGTIRMGKEMNILTPKQITKIHDWQRISIGRDNIVGSLIWITLILVYFYWIFSTEQFEEIFIDLVGTEEAEVNNV